MQFQRGGEFICLYLRKRTSTTKRNPQERDDAICTGESSFHPLLRKRSEWDRKQDPEIEGLSCDGALFVSSLAPQWLAQQCQRARSGSHISCTLTHTHTQLYFTSVGAVCYPSGSVPSACLSAHHINPIMLHCLGCSGLWPAAQWKKRRRTWRGGKGKGKVRKREGHTWTQRLSLKSESWLQDSGAGKASYWETHSTTVPTKSLLYLSLSTQQPS